ncbi:MAG TPA: hypothetical protein DD473_05770 [Planctomycetaceae bacterium]|nr:hypothetical protein [Planctomycetaceae bacterium]
MKMKIPFIGTLLILTLISVSTDAGEFDCRVIYDEFDSLMNKQFLINPSEYVNTVKGRLSRDDYFGKQKGLFLLNEERKDLGIAIIHTNNNTWGKLLYKWEEPSDGDAPILILKEVVLYRRVLDGTELRIFKNIIVKSSFTVDLDSGKLGTRESSDLWFENVDGKEMYLKAINGASVDFPMESMCKKQRQNRE